MLKCEIVFDRNKILFEKLYTPEKIQYYTDNLFLAYGLKKTTNGFFIGSNDDTVKFMGAILSLKRMDWFVSYVDKWIWYENDNDGDYGEFYTEDLKAQLLCKPKPV